MKGQRVQMGSDFLGFDLAVSHLWLSAGTRHAQGRGLHEEQFNVYLDWIMRC